MNILPEIMKIFWQKLKYLKDIFVYAQVTSNKTVFKSSPTHPNSWLCINDTHSLCCVHIYQCQIWHEILDVALACMLLVWTCWFAQRVMNDDSTWIKKVTADGKQTRSFRVKVRAYHKDDRTAMRCSSDTARHQVAKGHFPASCRETEKKWQGWEIIHLSHSLTSLIGNPLFLPASNISFCFLTSLDVVHHSRVWHCSQRKSRTSPLAEICAGLWDGTRHNESVRKSENVRHWNKRELKTTAYKRFLNVGAEVSV